MRAKNKDIFDHIYFIKIVSKSCLRGIAMQSDGSQILKFCLVMGLAWAFYKGSSYLKHIIYYMCVNELVQCS